jgi:hypothetical protein
MSGLKRATIRPEKSGGKGESEQTGVGVVIQGALIVSSQTAY